MGILWQIIIVTNSENVCEFHNVKDPELQL